MDTPQVQATASTTQHSFTKELDQTNGRPSENTSNASPVDKELTEDRNGHLEKNMAAETSAPPTRPQGFPWFLIVISILTSTFLFGLDNTVVADVQPAIIERFNSIDRLSWISVAFMLGAAATNLFWGQMYAQFNTKWLYITCILLFEVGSAVCGAAPTMNALIVGRAICGAGGAGMYTGVMTLLSVSTTEQERALYLGIPGLTWGVATVLGPIVGGAFTISKVGWRFAFYINLIIGAAASPITLFLLPSTEPRPGVRLMARLREIDFVGLLLMTGIFISGLMAIAFGGVVFAWDSGSIIACFVVSGTLIIVYWTQQILCIGVSKERRSIPLEFLKNKTLVIIFLNETCASTAAFVSIYFIPLYFQFVRGDSALMGGVRLLPFVCFLVTAIILCGFVVSKYGNYTAWFFGGGVLIVIGGALMYTVTENTSTAKIYGYTILIGTGAGAYLQLPFAAAQTEVEPHWIPVAVGIISFCQLAAPAITLSISNTMFLNKATSALKQLLPEASEATIQRVISGVGTSYVESLPSATQQQVNIAIVNSVKNVYVLVFTAGALTLVLSTFLLGSKVLSKRKGSTPNKTG